MAIGFRSGKDGYVVLNSDGEYAFGKWSAKIHTKDVPVNNFVSGGFDDNVEGFSNAELSMTGPWLVGGMPVTSGQVYEFHLGTDAGLEDVYTARVTGVTKSNDAEGTPTLEITAKSKGAFSLDVDGGLDGL